MSSDIVAPTAKWKTELLFTATPIVELLSPSSSRLGLRASLGRYPLPRRWTTCYVPNRSVVRKLHEDRLKELQRWQKRMRIRSFERRRRRMESGFCVHF